ncbi:MAG: DUF190 domain-containing protein [Rhizobiales bacterium]|nr:DUF190 domain-containing protein [Hyphomicrobiales bacterium]OJY02022.1 MAG: hypothetical protein BGP07_14440 [Rhizobiales bacterium 63-22]
MQLPEECTLLRIFFGEKEETEDGKLLDEAILVKAREMQIAGATVLRGVLGFGHSTVLHSAKVLRLSQDLPVVIEIIDAPDKIERLIPEVLKLSRAGLITKEKALIVQHSAPADGRNETQDGS